jgi:hypothetical protein
MSRGDIGHNLCLAPLTCHVLAWRLNDARCLRALRQQHARNFPTRWNGE